MTKKKIEIKQNGKIWLTGERVKVKWNETQYLCCWSNSYLTIFVGSKISILEAHRNVMEIYNKERQTHTQNIKKKPMEEEKKSIFSFFFLKPSNQLI